MHGQGHYITPVGQDPYMRPPALQPQVYQHGPSSFHPARSLPGYHHAPLSVPHLAPPAPAVSGGLGSGQSYLPHHRPPHINTHTSHPYPTSEQQWSQNVHQLPSAAPFPGPSGYQLPSSQGHSLGRGPFHQPPSAPPSLFPTQEHSCQQPVIPVLPPPPPLRPPPPPTSSPPVVPPIPPSSPPLDIGSKGEGGGSLNGSVDGNNLIMERPYSLKPAEDRSAYETEVLFQHTERSGTKAGSVDAVAAHSPTDSDMDMEDDITHPDEERKNCLSINVNGEHVPKSEDYAKEQLQASHHAGELTLVHENSLLAEASVSKAERGGSEIASFYSTMKVTSETDDSGMFENGQNEHPLDVSVEDSSIRHENFRQPCVPVLLSETVNGKLSDQAMEGANPFKLLQGDVSDNTSENDEENLLRNVRSRSANDGSSTFDAETGCDFGSKLRHATLTESSRQILSKSMVESPKNVSQTDKLSVLTHIVQGVSDRRHRGEEPVNIRDVSPRIKDSRNYDDSTGLESASLHKADVKCSSSKPNVDEFGRLVREGVSDSDTSDSPRYARRRARRTRKRSRSRSRSRSPHDRRRRRSPWRRKVRHSWSRSLSPKKRRSRSRTPVLQRDSEFGGDKLRREKGQIPGCFDFLRGKCYRGTTCRYSHHESDKNERSRYNWDKQHFRDGSHSLQSPDFHEESKVLDEEIKYRRSPADIPVSKEAKSVMRPLDDSTTDSPSILGSLGSGSLLVADVISSNHSNEIPQNGSVVSESSTWAMAATSTHYPADIPDAKQGPTSHLSSIGAPTTNSNPTEEVPSQSLKELLPSIANHLPHSSIPMPSALQAAQPITQDYNSNPPIPWNHMIPENNSPYQAPEAYQHSHFQGLSKPLSSSFVQLPLPPPPAAAAAAATGERSISLVHMQQSKLHAWNGLSSYTSVRSQPTESPFQSQTAQYQANSFPREPNQMLNSIKNFGSGSLHVSNLMARQGGPQRVVEDRFSGPPVQAMNPSLAQAQPNTLQLKGMHSFVAGGLPSGSVSNYRPYFQHASYGMQHSAADLVPASHAELGMVSSSTSRITPEFFETNRPSYARDFLESRSSNYLNTCASTFDLPQSSKFSSNVLIQDNHTAINTEYGAPVGMSTTPVDAHKIGIVGSENRSVLPRVSGDQYDPLFDYIEPASNSFSKADHRKHEITGDSDEVLGFIGSGRVLNMKSIKQEGGSAASANDSLENEECGETADIEVDGVLNATPSNPNDATNMDAGDIEIDQVKTYGKKKKSKERSMKHFKISIATFVKEVLKPSWRQGNMSKEAFKTIVKKTVDKVSEAMKSHQIPKSQAKINHYIDSSRGKLTKLVMGYVDKYVKV